MSQPVIHSPDPAAPGAGSPGNTAREPMSEPLLGRPSGDLPLAERIRRARVEAFLGGDAHLAGDKGVEVVEGRSPSVEPSAAGDTPAELDHLVQVAGQLYAASVTEETRASYARRWFAFVEWCETAGMQSLPAAPETLMLYLAEGAERGDSASTLQGRSAAINRVHLECGQTPPGTGPSMRLLWKGLRRAAAPARAIEITALRIAGLREVCRVIDASGPDPVELRDRAVLGLFLAGASATEIANLEWSHVQDAGPALRLSLRPHRGRHRTRDLILQPRVDPESGSSTPACPVAALSRWRDHALSERGDLAGPLFCSFDNRCALGQPLDRKAVAQVRAQRVSTLGLHSGGQATLEQAMALLGHRHPIDLRDKAMLTLGFAGAMRRGEVTRLHWSDLTLTQDGLLVRMRTTKTNMDGLRPTQIGIPYGRSEVTCPVTAFLAWRSRVEAQYGPVDTEGWVFTTAGRRGRAVAIGQTPITPDTLTRVVHRRAHQAHLSGHWGGRSLRAGFISTAADLDIPLEAIATQSRHKTLDKLAVYIRDSDPFRRNAAARVGL